MDLEQACPTSQARGRWQSDILTLPMVVGRAPSKKALFQVLQKRAEGRAKWLAKALTQASSPPISDS